MAEVACASGATWLGEPGRAIGESTSLNAADSDRGTEEELSRCLPTAMIVTRSKGDSAASASLGSDRARAAALKWEEARDLGTRRALT